MALRVPPSISNGNLDVVQSHNYHVNTMSIPSSTRILIRRIEALESTARRAAPQKRNLLLEMSITAMALAWTPDEVEEILAAAERSNLDELPPELGRRWARSLDCISRRCFGKIPSAMGNQFK